MVANVSFNPYGVSNAAGSFVVQTDGDVQGVFMDDPAVRFALRTGIIAGTETLPMWGGIGISENIPTVSGTTPDQALGTILGRATNLVKSAALGLTGFTVFNQAHNLVTTVSSPVPMGGSQNTISFFRLGSGARIAVACDPSLVDLEGDVVGSLVSWDFTSQRLVPYVASGTTVAITSAVWAATNGGQLTIVMTAASNVGAVGDSFAISGATNTGTGGAAAINQSFIVSAFTDNEHFILAAPAATGVYGTIGGSPVQVESGGALPCLIDRISTGNSMIVNYNPLTGYATWNRSGSTAVIQI